MTHGLHLLDHVVFLVYLLIVASYGYWVYQRKNSALADSKDFFLDDVFKVSLGRCQLFVDGSHHVDNCEGILPAYLHKEKGLRHC